MMAIQQQVEVVTYAALPRALGCFVCRCCDEQVPVWQVAPYFRKQAFTKPDDIFPILCCGCQMTHVGGLRERNG